MSAVEIRIPDIGTDEKVDVVEVLVAAGESVEVDAGLITLESDKASMDVPSTHAGVVEKVIVRVGDKVGKGDLIAVLEKGESPPLSNAPQESDRVVSEPKAKLTPPSEESAALSEPATGKKTSASEPAPESPPEAAAEPEPSQDSADPSTAAEGQPPSSESPPESDGEVSDRAASAGAASNGGGEGGGLSPLSAAPSPSSKTSHYADVLVLGSGPGGYTAAFRAADLGQKVVLVERYPTLGGVCLNVGCIPSKAYLHVARVIEEAADLGAHGVTFGEPKLDLDQLRAWKDQIVGRLTGGLATMATQRQVRVITGTGRFTSPHTLEATGAEGSHDIQFDHAIIAVGSRGVEIPGIPYDDPRVMDSTGALTLPEVPEKLLIVGGGIIGLEMACVYGALGSQITVVELLDGLIPGCDRDLVKPFERRLKKRYKAKIHVKTKVLEIESGDDGLTAFMEGKRAPESELFDRALVSVGRRPNSDRVDIEATGVRVDERGFIEVDSQLRTSVRHIFAIGDIVPGPMLAHKASHEGKVAAEAIAGEKSHFDARVIPSVAYTDPEIAWVGLTETDAEKDGTAYEVGSFPWAASGRAIGMGRTEGLTKILFDPTTRRVLGAGVVGPNAGDLISELALAIEMDCEASDLGLTVHPHPTLSETVAFASEVFEGTVTDLYLKKKR